MAASPAVTRRRFTKRRLAAIHQAKILGIRAGRDHRFTWVWVVVVDDRVYIRSWNDRPTGWFRAFEGQPLGAIKIADREVAIRARKPRGQRLMAAIERAYGEKYTTPASLRYVRGFKTARRRQATIEVMPHHERPGQMSSR